MYSSVAYIYHRSGSSKANAVLPGNGLHTHQGMHGPPQHWD